MLLALITLMSGFLFACRISDVVVERKWIARGHMTKIGTAYFLALIASAAAFAHSSPLLLWACAFAPFACLSLAFALVRARRSRAFRSRFREALTLILLRMKAGKSFRLALAEAIEDTDPRWRPMFVEIRELVVFSQQTEARAMPEFHRALVTELRAADTTPHAAIRRLENFRDRIRIEDDFRHRSGQVLRQIRAQSALLAGLYIAVFAFVARQFGWQEHVRLLFASACLFLTGLAWIWLGGRRIKWKT